MKKTITPEETKELFRFCHKHYVYQYDLQVELVDHLASSIEEQWENNPELPFRKALMNTFSKFGIYGFSKIKEKKQKELRKKYDRMLWNYLFDFYRWPKMLLTIALTVVLYTIFRIAGNGFYVMAAYFIALVLFIIYYHFILARKKYRIKVQPGKSFLLLERLRDVQIASVLIVQIPINGYNASKIFESDFVNSNVGMLIISFFTVSFTILIYGNLFFLTNKIKEHFMEQFGEFAI